VQPEEAGVIDFEALAAEVFDNAVAALGGGALLVQERAQHLAPVRHIFAGDRYTIRRKKISEIESDRLVRAQLGLSVERMSPEEARPKTIRTKSPLRKTEPGNRWAGTYGKRPAPKWRERRMQVAQQHLADYDAEMASRKAGNPHQPTVLDRLGAHEVRSKRAASLRWGHAYIGGALRDSIKAWAPEVTGSYAESWITAGNENVDYAKYMEFGTRHAAAHPYLRPALAETRAEIVSRIAAAIKESSRTGGSRMDIEIEVRL
jgi:HK97 gp10 family phage protein